MASVWCAHDSLLSREVAIKVLSPQFQSDFRSVRRFAREARAAARLSRHRNIVTIYDVGGGHTSGDGGAPFIVMEHLIGGSVWDALRAGEIDTETARRWIHEAAAALDYAHARGVVHGDIKPGNLLLDEGRIVHIADFGIARIGSEETITNAGQLFGTAAYISPEQALGARGTEASDRYALSVVAFELLTGEQPFMAAGFMGTVRRHIDDQPPAASTRNPDLPRTVDPVLMRGMAKRPEQRWPTARAFADALEGTLHRRSVAFARQPSAAAAAGWTAPQRRRATQPRLRALAALAAAALLAGVAFGATGGRHKSSRPRVTANPALHAARSAPSAHTATAKPPAPRSAGTTPAPADAPPVASTPPPSPSAASLEAQGHGMMLDGNYAAAVPVLQRAVQSAPAGSLLYQWSLFDLAHSYREMGDLAAAIPLLQERLRYPYARPVVEQELNAALGAYRQQTAPGPPKQHGDHGNKDHGGGPGGD